MFTNNRQTTPPATAATTTSPTASAPQGVKPHRLIKLGVDVHWREHVVVRQIDGTAPQPAQGTGGRGQDGWKGSGGSIRRDR